MKNNIVYPKLIFLLLIIMCTLIYANLANALSSDLVDDLDRQEAAFVVETGLSYQQSIGDVISSLIRGFLSILAVIFIILIIVSGYNWMTAQGDETKVTKAKQTIQRAVVGLIIIAAAYSITYFVFKYMPYGDTTPGF